VDRLDQKKWARQFGFNGPILREARKLSLDEDKNGNLYVSEGNRIITYADHSSIMLDEYVREKYDLMAANIDRSRADVIDEFRSMLEEGTYLYDHQINSIVRTIQMMK